MKEQKCPKCKNGKMKKTEEVKPRIIFVTYTCQACGHAFGRTK